MMSYVAACNKITIFHIYYSYSNINKRIWNIYLFVCLFPVLLWALYIWSVCLSDEVQRNTDITSHYLTRWQVNVRVEERCGIIASRSQCDTVHRSMHAVPLTPASRQRPSSKHSSLCEVQEYKPQQGSSAESQHSPLLFITSVRMGPKSSKPSGHLSSPINSFVSSDQVTLTLTRLQREENRTRCLTLLSLAPVSNDFGKPWGAVD